MLLAWLLLVHAGSLDSLPQWLLLLAFSLESEIIPTKPHAKRSFGFESVQKSFQPNWFEKWPFLHCNKHYDQCLVGFFCHTCLRAFKQRRMLTSTIVDPEINSLIST